MVYRLIKTSLINIMDFQKIQHTQSKIFQKLADIINLIKRIKNNSNKR